MQNTNKMSKFKKQFSRLLRFISFYFNIFAKKLNRVLTLFFRRSVKALLYIRRKYFAEACLVMLTVFTLSFLMLNTRIAVVSCGGEVDIFRTLQIAPAAIAGESRFQFDSTDLVEQISDRANMVKVDIKHVFPVSIYVDGKKISAESTGGTVNSILSQSGIRINDGDLISHTLSAPLTPNMDISVSRVSYQNIEIQKNIPREVIKIKTNTIPSGTLIESKQGEDGLVVTVLQKKYLDSYLIDERYIEATIVKEPVASVLSVGTGAKKPTKPTDTYRPEHVDVETLSYSNAIEMKATAYTFGDGGIWGDHTATGKPVKVGYVAVDPKVIPLGSKLYIAYPNGSACYGYAVAQDTGGAIKGNRIDLFFNTRQECKIFGRRTVMVYVLE